MQQTQEMQVRSLGWEDVLEKEMSSVGNHCPVPTHVWNVCWVGAESSPRCVLSVEADILLRGCRSAAILLVRGEET